LHDAIELEKRGIPTALICTEEFIVPATTMARVCGIPEYPFVVIPHPLSSLTAAQVQARAAGVADQIAAILLQGAR
jgi:hypothetical protein